ncbi:ABC transporter gloK [Colletotrichum trifolii]|uniref:ABC transporter gloK n=1 Tax=Colletotrichum trifolii TaxID=5466 RepID=A0A4R8RBX0_COLTR|nr:ABC transporter gloK [Colletotrichum trifolii]
MRACLSSYLLPFLAPVIPRLCITVFTFAQPFLVDTTVTFVSQESPDTNYGRGLIGAWALAYLGLAVSNSIFMYHSLRFATRARGGLVGLIYRHAVHHREVDAGEITAVALMGTDVERIFGSMTVFHIVWGSLLDIAVASWLLGLQLSLACLAPILLSLVFIAAIPKVSAASNTAQKLWIEKIQQRLRATTTMLGEMKAVKMLGLTRVMESLIQGLRTDEINTSKGFRKLLVATLLLSLTPTSLAPIVTFAVYVVISIFWKSETLLPAQAFTSIALISLLTTPLLLFIQLLPVIVQSFACFGRIQEFCNYGGDARANLDERDDSQDQSEQDATDIELAGPGMQNRMSQKLDNVVASFRGESLGWKRDQPVLHNIDVGIRRGAVTVIVGSHITSISEQPKEVRHTDKRRKNGEKAVYKYYLENAGWNVVFLYVGGVVMWLFLAEFSTIWMKWWSESNAANPNQRVGYYLGIYAMFGVLGAVGASVAGWVAFLDVVSNTALNLHSDLLRTTLQATFRILSKVDSGELLNRFSEDMQLLDMDLPTAMVNASATAVTVVVKVAILAVFSQYLGITLPFLAIMLYFLQRFYLQTSRQVRLLGIEAKAPLYTHFSESVAGSATIRAFQWQSQYQNRNYDHIDTSQRPAYVQFCIQTWLAFVLNVMVTALAVILVSIVVTWHNKFSPGSVGVSLVMVIGFSEELARFIQTWTKMESSVGAVARIRRFVQETETEPTSGKRKVNKNWPRAGAVQFHRVVASYGVDTEAVLKGVSLSIDAGHHVAICGRSGSGKTSLILSLLQMVDVDEGKITVDGVDVSTLLQDELRSAVNVVSQDPFLVPGSIRFNINPSATGADDERITQALQRVGLWQAVQEQGGLDEALDDKAWSAGQKQLLCLARAMVKQSKLLILDEAMSSVDSHTESLMQNIVDTEFHGCTVLAVMHRLKHVDRYDRVALLGDGKLLEFGDPGSLIAGDTKFAELYKANGS